MVPGMERAVVGMGRWMVERFMARPPRRVRRRKLSDKSQAECTISQRRPRRSINIQAKVIMMK